MITKELLFTHCYADTDHPIRFRDRGKAVREIPWLAEKLDDDSLLDHTLEGARLGAHDDDEIEAWVDLKEP